MVESVRNNPDFNWQEVELVDAINWNALEDPYDLEIWNRLIANFWVPEKIALSNDLASWATLTDDEKLSTMRVFAGLTMLDTIQATVGAISLIPDSRTPHEEAVLTNIAFMESVHARSYSSVFSTLCSTEEINDVFRWSRENEFLRKKAAIILHYYRGCDTLERKIASVMLESFLFYSGFFMPLYWAGKSKLTNTADIISLIIRDESLHGVYIGRKFQQGYEEQTPERQAELHAFALQLMHDLMDNELHYTESLYDHLGLTEHVKNFLRYNANKALTNLGFEAEFNSEETKVLATVLAPLNPTAGDNTDFFSGSPTSYQMGETRVEASADEDWDF